MMRHDCYAIGSLAGMSRVDGGEVEIITADINTGRFSNAEMKAELMMDLGKYHEIWFYLHRRERGLNMKRDLDEHLAIPVQYCPFCGKKLNDERPD